MVEHPGRRAHRRERQGNFGPVVDGYQGGDQDGRADGGEAPPHRSRNVTVPLQLAPEAAEEVDAVGDGHAQTDAEY